MTVLLFITAHEFKKKTQVESKSFWFSVKNEIRKLSRTIRLL